MPADNRAVTRLESFRRTAGLRLWALRHIPLLAYLRPRVVEDSPERCVVAVPLSRRTRNHLGSMYFGALCSGADAAAALIGLAAARGEPGRFSILFKDVKGEFLRRAEGEVHFACEQGREIRELLARARASGERESLPVRVIATVPSLSGTDPVARFELTLSAKYRG
jgi:acyl-coenzyme A thioesterase PaaI-like protein